MRIFSILILLTCCQVSFAQEKSSVINLEGDLDDTKGVLRNLLDDYGSHLHKWDTDTKNTIWTLTLIKEKDSLIKIQKEIIESLISKLNSKFDSVNSDYKSKVVALKDKVISIDASNIDDLIKSVADIEVDIKHNSPNLENVDLNQKIKEISNSIENINKQLGDEIKSKKSSSKVNDKKGQEPINWELPYTEIKKRIDALNLGQNITDSEKDTIFKALTDLTEEFSTNYKKITKTTERQMAFKKYLNDLDTVLNHLAKYEKNNESKQLEISLDSIKLILTDIKSHVETIERIESDMNRLKKTPVAHVEVFNTDKYVSKDSLNRIIVMFSNSTISITASSYNFVLNGRKSEDKLFAKKELLRTVKSKLPDSVTIGLTQTIQIETTGLDQTYFKQYYNRRLRYSQLRTRFQIGISTGWTANYRSLSGLYNSNSTNIIEERDDNEYYYHNFSKISINVGVARKSHTFAVNYRFNKLGFIFEDEGSVNSATGLFLRDGSSSKVSSEIHAFGFQYEYTNYWKKWSPYVQCGLHALFKSKNDLNISATNRNFFGTSFNVGVGVSYKPTYCCSFYLSPTLMTMFNRKDASFISSRFYNYGVELGARINLRCLPKYKK